MKNSQYKLIRRLIQKQLNKKVERIKHVPKKHIYKKK